MLIVLTRFYLSSSASGV
uniref:Uncharacterized protein n=1 Tax=Arundo donax TaxID=35708 RepID=A0A0A9AID2_ARUDO